MSESLIAKIEGAVTGFIGALKKDGGYNYDWNKPVIFDKVLPSTSKFPSARIDLIDEKNIDELEGDSVVGPTGAFAGAYYNVLNYKITIGGGKDNGDAPSRDELFRALDDLKKVFGINYTLGNSGASIIMYRGFELVDGDDGLTIESSWLIRYYQSRTNPIDTAEV